MRYNAFRISWNARRYKGYSVCNSFIIFFTETNDEDSSYLHNVEVFQATGLYYILVDYCQPTENLIDRKILKYSQAYNLYQWRLHTQTVVGLCSWVLGNKQAGLVTNQKAITLEHFLNTRLLSWKWHKKFRSKRATMY